LRNFIYVSEMPHNAYSEGSPNADPSFNMSDSRKVFGYAVYDVSFM